MRRSTIRKTFNFLFIVIVLGFLTHCNSPAQEPAISLSRLRARLPLDSMKWFSPRVGWGGMVVLNRNPDYAYIQYREVRIPSLKEAFTAILEFKNDLLYTFSIVDDRGLMRAPSDTRETGGLPDYYKLAKILREVHGRPAFSGITPFRSVGRIDSTYQTTWTGGATIYTLQYSQHAGLTYSGSTIEK